MRNNSVTKRRRKIRTGRMKTHQPQSKRCKKISPQIGGIFTRNGWKCSCRVDGKVPEPVNYEDEEQEQEEEEEEEEDEYDEHGNPQPTRRILEGGENPLLPNDNLSVTEQGQITIDNKFGRRNLPRNLENGDIITEIKKDKTSEVHKVPPINRIKEFTGLLNTIGSNTVILTISRKHKGGTASYKPRYVKVKVVLPPSGLNPRQKRGAAQDYETAMMERLERRLEETKSLNSNVGGKKTTYRRKKHVTRRKINTKRRKVMVGGTIPDSTEWNSLGLDGKFKAIEAVSSIEELQTIWSYIASLKETTPKVEFQQLSNKVAVRKQVLNDDEGEDDSAKLNLKKTVICKCSKTERNKVNKGNDKRKETPKGEIQIVDKDEML